MQHILIIGAGQSATSLISYLGEIAESHDWQIILAEQNLQLAQKKAADFQNMQVVKFDVSDEAQVRAQVEKSDLVISMLPARFHEIPAKYCATLGRDFLTASYLTEDIKALEGAFRDHGKHGLMELGLDPGLDHMTAMQVLDRIKQEGGKLTGFETFTGGLLTEDGLEDNPWKYKFTWNPRNVVLAGSGNVQFIQDGRYKYIPYHRLFRRTEVLHIPGHGYFEGYANRDSLKYLDLYDLKGIGTLYRGTLRRPGFCKCWDLFVQLGATDDTYEMKNVDQMTHRQFINSFLQYNPYDSVELKLAHYQNIDLEGEEMYKLKWLNIFSDELVGLEKGTPAQILEHILRKKWTLDDHDRDLIVMLHKFDFEVDGVPKQIQANLVVAGDDLENTAMAKTVGLPLGIATKLLLTKKIHNPGVHIPTKNWLYRPILKELEQIGFGLNEREVAVELP